MKYGYTIIYVEDVRKTVEFYQNAFGFQQKFLTPENDYGGFLKTKATEKPFGVEMAFITENIESDFKKAIEMGATEYEPLTEKPWGQQVGYVRDNNGFLIEICTPIKT